MRTTLRLLHCEPLITAVPKATRERVGPDGAVMFDAHCAVPPATLMQLASAMKAYDVLFIEEVAVPGNIEVFKRLKAAIDIPLATGEGDHTLAESISQLEHRVAKLEERSSRSTNICELGAAAVEILKPIPVSILCNGEDCIATFFDANVGASGETDQEAFDGLREVLVGTFLFLDSRPGSELSPEIQRHLDVLRQLMRRKP